MTKKELELREAAVSYAYKENNIDIAIDYVMQLYERNSDKKLYRFRKPNQHEIDAIKESKIYLCRPRVYEDSGDCKWIDDIESLVKYVVTVKEVDKYKPFKNQLTSSKYAEVIQNIKNSSKYKNFTKTVCNLCLVSCITDKMTNYMWEEYAKNGEGICLEFDFEDVLIAVKKLGFRFFPIRYVDDREQQKDIQFGPMEYDEDAPNEFMYRKYLLSCMTKNKVPYAQESEWRILSEYSATPNNGESFDFIRPCRIHLGKNISRNTDFHNGIIQIANEYKIPITQH